MHLRSFLAGILVVSFVAAVASTVNNEAITTFEAGTPARADDVNGNFQALIDSINDNARRIEALEQNKTSCSLQERIAGSTFKLFAQFSFIGGSSTNTPNDNFNAFGLNTETFTFHEDGTLTSDGEISGVAPHDRGFGFPLTVQNFAEDFSDTGAWVLVGNELTITFEDESVTATVSPDGNTAFIGLLEPFGIDPGSFDPPGDAQQVVLGVFTRIEPYAAPEGLSFTLTNIDGSHLNGRILELSLTDEGSGGCLEFARSPINSPVAFAQPPENGWTKGDTFLMGPTEGADFWARRDTNDFLVGPIRLHSSAPQ